MAEAVQSQSIDNAVTNQLAVLNTSNPNANKNQESSAAPPPATATKLPAEPAESLANARHEFGEHGGVNMSIEASATFTVMEPDMLRKIFTGELGPDRDFYLYSRHFNPTVLNLSSRIAAMEGTEAAYCVASGMSAVFAVLLQICPAGSHVVASRCLYGGTYALLSRFLPRVAGLRTSFVDARDMEAVGGAVREGETRVIYVETMSNPSLEVADIAGLSAVARRKGVMLVVDNTFAPMVVSPARLGADVVLHSVSKFISGGADIIAGAICGPATLIQSMMDIHGGVLMMLGPTLNPKVAFELAERLPHLALRMKEHSARALLYASRMQQLGLKVIYPGLPSHPHHNLLRSIANPGYGSGGMLCLDMGTEARANRLLSHLQNTARFGLIAVSLGYYDTLMSCSGSSTASKLSEDEKQSAGISPGLVRMSVGYSGSAEQRWAQFEKALAACAEDDAAGTVSG